MPDEKTGYLKIVPEFQYDLISRIIPGLLLFSAVGIHFGLFPSPDELLRASAAPTFAVSIFVIMASWGAGICLSPFGHLLSLIGLKKKWENEQKKYHSPEDWNEIISEYMPYDKTPPEKRGADWYITLATNMLERLKTKAPQASGMIAKISGESAFGFNLCAGSIIWSVIVLTNCLTTHWKDIHKIPFPRGILAEPYLVPFCSLVFTVLMLYGMHYRSKRLIKRAISLHLALRKEHKEALTWHSVSTN